MSDFNIKTQRHLLPICLTTALAEEVEAMLLFYPLEQRIELMNHLIESMQLLERFYENGQFKEEVWETYMRKEDELAFRYGKEFGPFADMQIIRFFDLRDAMVVSGVVTPEVFKKLSPDKQKMTQDEFRNFMRLSRDLLLIKRRSLYLYKKAEWSDEKEETTATPDSIPLNEELGKLDKDVTRARQLLALYFFFRATGLQDNQTNLSGIVRFTHLLTGTKYSNIQNSELYKKYKKMPNYKKDISLITDLKFIRPYFEEMDMPEAIKLIDAEMKAAYESLPRAVRKRFKDE